MRIMLKEKALEDVLKGENLNMPVARIVDSENRWGKLFVATRRDGTVMRTKDGELMFNVRR